MTDSGAERAARRIHEYLEECDIDDHQVRGIAAIIREETGAQNCPEYTRRLIFAVQAHFRIINEAKDPVSLKLLELAEKASAEWFPAAAPDEGGKR